MSRSKRSAVQRYHDRVSGCYDDSYDDAYWQWHHPSYNVAKQSLVRPIILETVISRVRLRPRYGQVWRGRSDEVRAWFTAANGTGGVGDGEPQAQE
ncbi:MAG: hypothetical protein V1790_07695, partial [Planctomycetota bacterium]